MSSEQLDPGIQHQGGHEAEQRALRERLGTDSLTSRRDYLRVMTTVSGGLLVGSVAVSAGVLHRHGDAEAADVPLLRVAERLDRGQAVTFNYPGEHDRAMAVRLADGSVVGYSTVCTHLACGVLWRQDRGDEGELYCPCHEGSFDVRTGEVTGGPPPRGLPKVLLEERADGSVWAVGTAYSDESVRHAACRQLSAIRPGAAAPACARGGGNQP
ncbi:ubiquinol-cytochrome c reductase iron-sulfur subunit [Streptacidiphilus sp. N1-12]|uniref:Ubiquinol-cytochrome c reductase iron-sulfur subunit n=2 Tax=Streptacidiphilus alkalitolerans TaxID=3342712 RepID=A0ABV6W8D1_9ACTN